MRERKQSSVETTNNTVIPEGAILESDFRNKLDQQNKLSFSLS